MMWHVQVQLRVPISKPHMLGMESTHQFGCTTAHTVNSKVFSYSASNFMTVKVTAEPLKRTLVRKDD